MNTTPSPQGGLDLQEVEEAVKFLREHKRKEKEKEELQGEEPQLTFLQKIQQSQYWDFVLYGLVLVSLTLITHFIYLSLNFTGGFLPADTLERLSRLPVSGLVFVFAIAFVDLKFLFFERIFFKFSKRNGVNTFDYQESFKNLNQWQQVLIYTIRSSIYLFAFILIYNS
jgi:hypothetical protein